MRLVTRSDFDGLACAALLKEAGIIDHWKFAHPKDLQDGLMRLRRMTVWQMFLMWRAVVFGLTTIPASMRDSS